VPSEDPTPSNSPHSSRRFELEGRSLGYPTEFRDGSSIGGLFAVRSRVANELIADSGFRVAEIAPGRAVLALTGVQYTDTDCGAYEESAQAFFVRKVGQAHIPYWSTWRDILQGQIASHTWKLQVNTPLSRDCGIQMWGFPKTLDKIDFERTQGRAEFRLRMQGQEVLRYSVPATGTQTPAPIASPVYSIFEGAPHVAILTQRYRETGYHPGGGRLELGSHPLSEELRALGLPRRPLLATWNGHLSFSMSAPSKL
jgi:hypothetical protein